MAAASASPKEEPPPVWHDLVERVAADPEKLIDLQRLMTVLVVNGAAELTQLPRSAGNVKIEGSSDLGAKGFDEVEASSAESVELTLPPSMLLLQRGGSSRRGKLQTYGRAFEPVMKIRVVVQNNGEESAWVTPLALYTEKIAPFQVFIGTDRQPLDHVASQSEPLCLRPGGSVPVEIVAKVPKPTPGMALKNLLAREWIMFHVCVGSSKSQSDAVKTSSTTKEPWELIGSMAGAAGGGGGGGGGGGKKDTGSTGGIRSPVPACASLIGIRAVILWTRTAAQAKTLNKQSKPFVPRQLKNAFSSSAEAFYSLGPIDPVPAKLRRMDHVVGMGHQCVFLFSFTSCTSPSRHH